MWIKPHVAAFVLAMVWDYINVLGTRAFAAQSYAALPIAAILMLFWVAGVSLSRDRRLWPALIIGAVVGVWLGIIWP